MTKTEREALEAALRMAKLDGPLESWPGSFDIDDDTGDEVPSEDRVVGVVRRRGHDGRAAMWTVVAQDVPYIRAPLLVAAVNALPALLADSARAERLEAALRRLIGVMDMQEGREDGRFFVRDAVMLEIWREGKDAARAALEVKP